MQLPQLSALLELIQQSRHQYVPHVLKDTSVLRGLKHLLVVQSAAIVQHQQVVVQIVQLATFALHSQ